jgi:[acyl-carrier-protein] S-malonyltransferase
MASETAFLFPGQGSQSVGMLSDLHARFQSVGETFDQASEALGYDLWDTCANGPESKLNQTEVTQPAMLASDIATFRVWLELGGPEPTQLAGHSLGEYAALVAAESVDFVDAIRLVSLRGKLMQDATPDGTGAMAAVLGLDDGQVEQVCRAVSSDEEVSCANFNSPGQVVIAGHVAAVERACEAAKEAGARRAIVLPVSVPSHCSLMKSAADALSPVLAETEIRTPGIPVTHNVDAQPRLDPDDIRTALQEQLWKPVLWTTTVQRFATMGVSRMAECGPGRVLAGLSRRISRELNCAALTDAESIRTAIADWSST